MSLDWTQSIMHWLGPKEIHGSHVGEQRFGLFFTDYHGIRPCSSRKKNIHVFLARNPLEILRIKSISYT